MGRHDPDLGSRSINHHQHLATTKLEAFVCAAGTGGTLAGVSRFLKSKARATDTEDKDDDVKCYLVDPTGSGEAKRCRADERRKFKWRKVESRRNK